MKTKILLIALLTCSMTVLAQKQADNQTAVKSGMMWFNLSSLNWIDSFDSLHVIMEERYPFTEWKGINWDQKLSLTQPKIQEAQNEGDIVKLTGALFEYLLSIPDGHVTMFDLVQAFSQAKQSGSFGLNMIPITDGSIIANLVPEYGSAYSAGLRCGDEILSWNSIPILEVPKMEVYNNFSGLSANYATEEGRLLSRYIMLCRDSVGANVNVTFKSHETGSQQTISLTAVADTFNLLSQARRLTAPVQETNNKVIYKVLDGQIGYLFVQDEDASDTLTIEELRQTEIYLKVKEAITYFNGQNIEKLVFDLRYNNGGHDLLGSLISGFFIQTPMFYEYVTGNSDDNYAIIDSIITVPETPLFNGEVVVMVSPKNISTGEGIPMMLQRLDNAQVVSFWGSNGSFAITPNVVIMPDSMQFILFPYSRSLDHNQAIQLDSDSTLVGGIQPDIRIPLTVERVIEQWQDGKDVELEYAISILLDIPENIEGNGTKLYPNPANDFFITDYKSKNPATVSIIDIHGRLVTILENYKSGQVISIRVLPPGVYFVNVTNFEINLTNKLIIER